MRCHVVLDKKGKIVSVGYLDRPELEALYDQAEPKDEDYSTLRAGPVADADQTVVELAVPNEHVRMPPADFIDRLYVDLQAWRSGMKPKKR